MRIWTDVACVKSVVLCVWGTVVVLVPWVGAGVGVTLTGRLLEAVPLLFVGGIDGVVQGFQERAVGAVVLLLWEKTGVEVCGGGDD